MSKKRPQIKSLQALRALAFIGIFLCHADVNINWSALGVSIFFVLSGFLMVYQYEGKELSVGIKDNLLFSWKKISKLYPLHIVMMVLSVLRILLLYLKNGVGLKKYIFLFGKIFLNITLLQTWVPHHDINVSINGVAWYLSVALFLYFLFPYLKKWINKINLKTVSLVCILLLLCEILLCIPMIRFFGLDNPVYIWFMYCFPVFRIGDFFVGCCLGKWYLDYIEDKSIPVSVATIGEILLFVISVFIVVWAKTEQQNIMLQALQNWTTIYIPIAALWVLAFSKKQGMLSKVLTNKITLYLGNISSYLFLIHLVIIQFFSAIMDNYSIVLLGYKKVVIVIMEFICSWIGTIIYQRINKKIKQTRNA